MRNLSKGIIRSFVSDENKKLHKFNLELDMQHSFNDIYKEINYLPFFKKIKKWKNHLESWDLNQIVVVKRWDWNTYGKFSLKIICQILLELFPNCKIKKQTIEEKNGKNKNHSEKIHLLGCNKSYYNAFLRSKYFFTK